MRIPASDPDAPSARHDPARDDSGSHQKGEELNPELVPLIYNELRRLAAQKMARESPGHTLQPTALVHEAWVRMAGNEVPQFVNRAHFFGAAAEAMRRILVENARHKRRLKHGGQLERVDLEGLDLAIESTD